MSVTRSRETCHVYWISRSDSRLSSDALLTAVGDLRYLVTRTGGSASGFLTDEAGVSDVVSSSWTKDTRTPAGVWSMSLVPNKDYANLIRAGDLLIPICGYRYADDAKRTLITVLVVDSVHEDSTLTGTGAIEPIVQVTARDLGKVPQETSLVLDPAFAASAVTADNFFNAQLFGRLKGIYGGSPVQIVMTIFDILYNSAVTGSGLVQEQWRLSSSAKAGVSLMNLLDLKSHVQAPMFGYWVPNTLGLAEAGNAWQLMKSMSNPIVNEFFVDVRDLVKGYDNHLRHTEDVASAYLPAGDVRAQRTQRDAVANNFNPPRSSSKELAELARLSQHRVSLSLVFRQMPYDTATFEALPEHVVTEAELLSAASMSRSDSEVYNLFRVRTPSLPQIEQELVFGLKVNEESIRRFGIRRYEGETLYPLADEGLSNAYKDGKLSTPPGISQVAFDYYVGLVSTWFAYNQELYAMPLHIRYRPDIRVGNTLRFVRTVRIKGKPAFEQTLKFYIEGVKHNFQAQPGGSSTTLTLVRGVVQDRKRPEANLYFTGKGPSLKRDPYKTIRNVVGA